MQSRLESKRPLIGRQCLLQSHALPISIMHALCKVQGSLGQLRSSHLHLSHHASQPAAASTQMMQTRDVMSPSQSTRQFGITVTCRSARTTISVETSKSVPDDPAQCSPRPRTSHQETRLTLKDGQHAPTTPSFPKPG